MYICVYTMALSFLVSLLLLTPNNCIMVVDCCSIIFAMLVHLLFSHSI